jgi:hypothetical protein
MIDYNNLPNDPFQLWSELMKVEEIASVCDLALSRAADAMVVPTTGHEDKCSVWVVVVPACQMAFKMRMTGDVLQAMARAAVTIYSELSQTAAEAK